MEKKNKFKTVSTAIFATAALAVNSANAEIACNTAQMQAMDKITGKVEIIDVPINTEVKYGTFSVIVRSCKTRSPEETPENFAFVDVVDNPIKEEPINIFKGWMLSSNPAINPVEHPIYDIWLLKCHNTDIDKSKQLSQEELAARDFVASIQVIPTKETANPIDEIIDANMAFEEEEVSQENTTEEENLSKQNGDIENSFIEFSVSEDIEPEIQTNPENEFNTIFTEENYEPKN